MKYIALLFSLLLVVAVGCGDTAVSEKSPPTESAANTTADTAAKPAESKGKELDQVDAAGLETVLADNAVTLIDFTAVW